MLTIGWLLGGTVGVGTLLYAFGIGPLVQFFVRIIPNRVLVHSGWAPVAEASSDSGVKTSAGRNRSRRNRLTTMGECPTQEATASTQTC